MTGAMIAMMRISLRLENSYEFKETQSSNVFQKKEFYNTRSFVNETQVHVKENNSLDHTVKNLPLVKIYGYVPDMETDADKARRFDGVKAWLTGVPQTKPKISGQCKNYTKQILWFDVWHNGTGIRTACRRCKCRCEVDFFIFNESDTQRLDEPFGGDAVLFQISKLKRITNPPPQREGQVLVAVEREPTAEGRIQQQEFEYVFNWTMAFRKDSNIVYPYGKIVPRIGAPPTKNYSAIYHKKKRGIIWFVSNCRTRTRHEDYARELRKYIDIDIVGKCGSDVCPNCSKECVEKIEEEYFFRFNFENDYLTDYVTEELFDNFAKDMIQVVGGSADFHSLVQVKIIIDTKKFDTPKQLAAYLNLLMSSEDLYTEYLRTKDNYQIEQYKDMPQRGYCELCPRQL